MRQVSLNENNIPGFTDKLLSVKPRMLDCLLPIPDFSNYLVAKNGVGGGKGASVY